MDANSLIGKNLRGYKIVGFIGSGGMATVYKAYQESLNRYVAIKVLAAHLSGDREFRERFIREAKSIAKLRHPNILSVFDFGEDAESEMLYIVMQYVEGGTLNDLLKNPIPVDEVIQRLSGIADALDYAHSEGIIHRDVKPQNILLTKRGHGLLSDFGIAKMASEGTQLTQVGVGIGTPVYMSPEQARGESVNGRSDQYSFAVMVYQMLTGTVPFSGNTPFSIVNKHIHELPPPLTGIDKSLANSLNIIMSRALAKNPANRFATISEFIDALKVAASDNLSPSEIMLHYGDPSVQKTILPDEIEAYQPPFPTANPGKEKRKSASDGTHPSGIIKMGTSAIRWGGHKLFSLFMIFVIVIFILIAFLGGILAWSGPRVLDRIMQDAYLDTSQLEPNQQYYLKRSEFRKRMRTLLRPYLLDDAQTFDIIFESPDHATITGVIYEKSISLDASVSVEQGAPTVQVEHINGVPLILIGRFVSDMINDSVAKAFADQPIWVHHISINPDEIAFWTTQNESSSMSVKPSATPTIAIATPTPIMVIIEKVVEVTPTSTLTLSPAPTRINGDVSAKAVGNTNLRLGPGINYPIIGLLKKGEMLKVIGKNEKATWWQLETVTGKSVWIIANRVTIEGDVGSILVVKSIPAPPKVPAPTATPTSPVSSPNAAPAN